MCCEYVFESRLFALQLSLDLQQGFPFFESLHLTLLTLVHFYRLLLSSLHCVKQLLLRPLSSPTPVYVVSEQGLPPYLLSLLIFLEDLRDCDLSLTQIASLRLAISFQGS